MPRAQVAEEYLPLVVLPLAGSLLATALICGPGRKRSDLQRRMDEVQVSLFRVTLLCFMFWAAFHKLNTDFFDPQTSCSFLPFSTSITQLLQANELVAQLIPFAGFLGEAGVSLLLLVYPRVGIPFTLLVMGTIGRNGPLPICSMVLVTSLSFLRRGDAAIMLEGWREHWRPSATVLALLLAASALFYTSGRHWLEHLLFHLTIGAILFSFVHVLVEQTREAWGDGDRLTLRIRAFLTPDFRTDPVLPSVRWARAVLVCIVLAGMVSGFSPYLGLKFRLSSTMFANLRVDDDRWNSIIIPRWFYLREHDPYIHVTRASVVLPSGEEKFNERQVLSEGLFTRTEMRRRLAYMKRKGIEADLQLSYAGVSREARSATSNYGLMLLLDNVDEIDRLLPSHLTLGKPQHCTH
jgi:hypothetical protein